MKMNILQILETVRTIAVVGISNKPGRAGQYVPQYLKQQGYSILGVRPPISVPEVFDVPLYPTLAAIGQPIDLVLLFRRNQDLPGHLDDILGVHPKVVWMQLGISHPEVARRLEQEGIVVVQDRCLMVDHQRAFNL